MLTLSRKVDECKPLHGGRAVVLRVTRVGGGGGGGGSGGGGGGSTEPGQCRAVQVGSIKTRVESAWFQRLKLKHDVLLSSFAFKFKLRRYTKELEEARAEMTRMHAASAADAKVDEAKAEAAEARAEAAAAAMEVAHLQGVNAKLAASQEMSAVADGERAAAKATRRGLTFLPVSAQPVPILMQNTPLK